MLCAINIIPDASLLKIKISIFFYRTPCAAEEKQREIARGRGEESDASTFWSSLFAFIANFWLPTVQPISCQAAAQNDNPVGHKKNFTLY